MARFYAEIEGNRGRASRMGTEKSGMWAHVRGWNVGVRIDCFVDDDGRDAIRITRTGGSNGSHPSKHLVTLVEGRD